MDAALQYMESQVPGVLKSGENKHLLELLAIGRANRLNITNILHNIHQTFLMHQHFDAEHELRQKAEGVLGWMASCRGQLRGKHKQLCLSGLKDYNKRFGGVGCSQMIEPKIKDQLGCFIEYVMVLQGVLKNALRDECCPLQVDLVSVPNELVRHGGGGDDEKVDIPDMSDDSDDDDEQEVGSDSEAVLDELAKVKSLSRGNIVNPWPEDVEALLKAWNIAHEKHEVALAREGWEDNRSIRFASHFNA